MEHDGSSDLMRRHFAEVGAGGFSRVDGTVDFYSRVNALLTPEMVALDFGAGRGEFLEDPIPYRRELRRLQGKVAKLIGADLDPVVLDHPALDEAVLMPDLLTVPIESESVDLVLSDHTFEHIVDPEAAAAELDRVLKPGGWICARTPNKWGYVGLGARAVPNQLHVRFLKRLQPHRQEQDVFPVAYKLNTRREVARVFPPDRYDIYMYTVNAEPAYVGSSRVGWHTVSILNRIVPQSLGGKWMIFLRKRG